MQQALKPFFEAGTPVIVGADLNSPPTDDVHKSFTQDMGMFSAVDPKTGFRLPPFC